ncbi:MAG: hypothetical protein K9L57_09640 [Spirochaetaceae bacterium]|nr:hypothetical protein [Spirochaetia bacterium]MCF7951883.1 hypothetical protein [Spirochaetaceae bacterium]
MTFTFSNDAPTMAEFDNLVRINDATRSQILRHFIRQYIENCREDARNNDLFQDREDRQR